MHTVESFEFLLRVGYSSPNVHTRFRALETDGANLTLLDVLDRSG